jgi:outer membrane protein TolC
MPSTMRAAAVVLAMAAMAGLAAGAQESMTALEASERAKASSPEMRYAAARIGIQSSAYLMGFRSFLPNLSAGYSDGAKVSDRGPDDFTKTASLQVTQLLWDGGRTAGRLELQAAAVKVAREDIARQGRQIGERAVNLYWNAVAARDKLVVARASLESAVAQRLIVQKEVELGLSREIDLADIQMREIELGISEASTRLAVSQAERDLSRAIGVAAEDLPVLVDRIDTAYGGLELDAASIAEAASARNPDIQKLRASLEEKKAQAVAAERSWLPNLNLTGNYSVSGDAFPLTEPAWSLALSVAFSDPMAGASSDSSLGSVARGDRSLNLGGKVSPLPDPGSVLERESARIALDEARGQLARVLSDGAVSFAALADDYGLKRDIRGLSAKKVGVAERKLALYGLMLELGQVTRQEMVASQMELANAKIELIEAASALLLSERSIEGFLDIDFGSLAAYLVEGGAR